jgi:HAD superfamily hydrolase (TIGR01484 family)
MNRLLLCTDLDRTLLPNGQAPESPGARDRFARLATQPDVLAVYVTGRDPGLVDEAIESWGVPVPDLLIGDVGTTIASRNKERWKRWDRWDEAIAGDWGGRTAGDLQDLLSGVSGLTLQESSRQTPFKLSYYAPADTGETGLVKEVGGLLREAGVRANVIWSVDDSTETGLLDVLPAAATKRLAIEFVMNQRGYRNDETLFAGDSGNDLDVLVSPIPAVLVANARPALRQAVLQKARAEGNEDRLYCARGGALGMNGNYAAGILEGVLHFHPGWSGFLEDRT